MLAYINKVKTFIAAAFLMVAAMSPAAVMAGGGEHAENVDIMHHIGDAHEIHFIDGVSIYLPVILWDNGLKIFSSSHLYHNPQHQGDIHYYEYEGYIMTHGETILKAPNGLEFDEEGKIANAAVLDFSITKTVVGIFLAIIVMFLIFPRVAKSYKTREGKAPKGLQNLMEPLVLFVRDEVAIPSIGKHKADKFMPFLLTIFFFIWISNILGLIPFIGGFNVAGQLSVTMALAGIVFIITTINGNKHYWMHILWPPGVPAFVKIILVPIEILGIFIKPAVLMLRLMANISAGHIILLALVSLVFIAAPSGAGAEIGVGIGATAFMVFMNFIELLVAFLQAYVFTLLAAIYFGGAVEEAHH